MNHLRRAALCVFAMALCAAIFPAGHAAYGRAYPPVYPPEYRHPRQIKTGEVKLITASRTASVYVDGGFAGKTDKLKKFPLKPGKHRIEVREEDGRAYSERVQVIRGKTVELRADPR